jgi:dTDP-4-dehydrorhamnose 3,5-epimerase
MNKKSSNINDILITPLKIISVLNGDVMHAIKSSDEGYENFGEAYFSNINSGAIKAWKRHRKMILNLVVPLGKVKFVLYDDREKSKTYENYSEVILSRDNFCRLTVPPMIWMGFIGLDNETSIVLNIANIEHSPDEVEKKELNEILYNWELD